MKGTVCGIKIVKVVQEVDRVRFYYRNSFQKPALEIEMTDYNIRFGWYVTTIVF